MKADVLRGHLAGLVLAVLEPAPLHGYGVIEALSLRSGGELDVPTGTVYPALHRLERMGLIDSEWEPASGRRRRIYSLTANGRRALADERESWQRFASTISAVLTESP